jgi:VWFA-related protein
MSAVDTNVDAAPFKRVPLGRFGMRRIFAVFVMIVCACASLAFAQASAKSDSHQRLVELTVAASDAKNDPVVDLRAGDIQIREDGTARSVVFFRFARSKSTLSPPGPGEFTNRPAAAPTLILLDRWNERMLTMASAWQDIRAALAHLETVDRVYVYFLTSHGDLFPVHPLPEANADLRVADPPTSAELVAKLNEAVRTMEGLRATDALDPVLRANTTFQALEGLFSRMASIAGRKNLIWVTHGLPLNVSLPGGGWADFTVPVQNLSQAAARSQVAIYTVVQSAEGAGADPTDAAKQTLQMFSALTGGRSYASGKSESAIQDALADSRGSYRLACYSPVRENDRKEHKIRVESVRKGVRLLTREGYFGNATEPDPDRLAEAAFSGESHCPFDATEIALRVAMSRKPPAGIVHFDVYVDPADVLLERRGEGFQGSLTVMFALYRNSVLQGVLPPIQKDLTFTQEQFNSVLKDGIVIPQDVTVSDQIQQVRVMVFDRTLHGLGSVTIPTR